MSIFNPRAYTFTAKKTETLKICNCQGTRTPPICDDSHRGTHVEPLQFQVEEGKTYKICQCLLSSTFPICDGSQDDVQDCMET
jgi:CDGSH-type Zn-finger protein